MVFHTFHTFGGTARLVNISNRNIKRTLEDIVLVLFITHQRTTQPPDDQAVYEPDCLANTGENASHPCRERILHSCRTTHELQASQGGSDCSSVIRCSVVCLRVDISMMVMWDDSDAIEYDRRRSELSNAPPRIKQDNESTEKYKAP